MADDRPITSHVELSYGRQIRLATPQARIIARAIDIFWYTGLLSLYGIFSRSDYLENLIENPGSAGYTGISIDSAGIFFLAIFATSIHSEDWVNGRKGVTGQSIGQALAGVRVVSAQDGGPIPYLSLFVRSAIPFAAFAVAQFLFNQTGLDEGIRWELSLTIVAVPILPVFWSSYRQGWHDNAVGTIVVAEAGFFSILRDEVKQWYGEAGLFERLRIVWQSFLNYINEGVRNWRLLRKLFDTSRGFLNYSLFLIPPVLGIIFWLDYLSDTSREECYTALDMIYEDASIEQLEVSDNPHTFVDTLIVPTLKNRDELLEIGYLEKVSEDSNCEFDSLQRHADGWADDYQQRLNQRDESQETQKLDELWSKFPRE